MKRKLKYSINSTAIIVSAIAIVLVLNLILSVLDNKINLSIDLTKNELFVLSDKSIEVAKGIDSDIDMWLLTDGTQNETYTTIENVLSKYSQANGKIHISKVDASKKIADVKPYLSGVSNLSYGSVIIKNGDKSQIADSTDFFTDDGQSYIERVITNKLLLFLGENNASVALFLKGHGEQMTENFVGWLDMENFKVYTMDTMADDIPADQSAIVFILMPQTDFSAEEIDKLDKYLEFGGCVQIVFDPLTKTERLDRLESYLSKEWGITRNNVMTVDPEGYIENSAVMLAKYGDHDIAAPIAEAEKRLGYSVANNFDISSDMPEGVEAKAVMKTSDKAYYRQTASVVSDGIEKQADDPEGEFTVMAAAKRTIYDINDNEKTGKIVICGSSEIFGSLLKDTRFANDELLMNAVKFMSGQDTSVSVKAKKMPNGRMLVDSKQAWTWFGILVVFVPVLILVCGLVVFLKRRYK